MRGNVETRLAKVERPTLEQLFDTRLESLVAQAHAAPGAQVLERLGQVRAGRPGIEVL